MEKFECDAVLCFMGGVTKNEAGTVDRANHLSIGRMFQVYDLRHKGLISSDTPILVGGGQINYHTDKRYEKPMSDTTSLLLEGVDGFSNVVSLRSGFDTVSEASSMLNFVKQHKPEWRKFIYNSDLQHNPRIEAILNKVFGSKYQFEANPLSCPANRELNIDREKLITDLFTHHFSKYTDGCVPYIDDEHFYQDNQGYFVEQRSIIEQTSKSIEDLAAYDGDKRRRI